MLALILFVEDDLRQGDRGEVILRAVVDDADLRARLHHLGEHRRGQFAESAIAFGRTFGQAPVGQRHRNPAFGALVNVVGPQFGFHDHRQVRPHAIEERPHLGALAIDLVVLPRFATPLVRSARWPVRSPRCSCRRLHAIRWRSCPSRSCSSSRDRGPWTLSWP